MPSRPVPDAAGGAPDWPGARLGLPQSGTRSVARAGRRVAGVVVDWLLALLVTEALLDGSPWAVLLVFGVVHALGVGTLGGSPGHLLLGMRVVRVDGRWPGPLKAVLRAVLLCLVVPAVVWDLDSRGLHDRIPDLVLLRR